mmetsp:Transcript_23896/g.54438  ORF Transcript_23896/g.54438 Transcript_23896/m.54438 type:complete len:1030 (-) Transcript_23896:59-3148(-)
MWAYDFFKNEDESKTLVTHLKANNIFLRCWFKEVYLPEAQRLGPWTRLARLVMFLSIYLVVLLYICVGDSPRYGRLCAARASCKHGCISDHFPQLLCQQLNDTLVDRIEYGGNVYESIFEYIPPDGDRSTFDQCASLVPTEDAAAVERLETGRVPRTQVCFPRCRKSLEGSLLTDPLYPISSDTRPLEGTDDCSNPDALLCVVPPDTCEKASFLQEWGVTDSDFDGDGYNDLVFSWPVILLAIVWHLPVQFLLDTLIIYTGTVKVESIQDVAASVKKCGLQYLAILSFVTLVFLVGIKMFQLYTYGRPQMLWVSFFATVWVDQVRNLLVQTVLWFVLLRRCGQVPVGNEASMFDLGEEDDAKSPVEMFRYVILLVTDSKVFERFIYSLVGLYALFILVQMALAGSANEPGYLTDEWELILEDIDTVFLIVFTIEIVLRLISDGIDYLRDVWNLFDATVVLVSLGFKFYASGGRSLAMFRLLRLFRLVSAIRKAGGGSSRKAKSGAGIQFSSPVERVLEIFKDIREIKGLPVAMRDNIDWCVDIIASNRLYAISVDTDKSKQWEGFPETEVNEWIRLATDGSTEGAVRDNDLETFLLGNRRRTAADANNQVVNTMIEVIAAHGVDSHDVTSNGGTKKDRKDRHDVSEAPPAQSPLKLLGAPSGSAEAFPIRLLDELSETISDWDFNFFQFEERLPRGLLPVVTMKSAVAYDLFAIFDVPTPAFRDFMLKIEEGYNDAAYHNASHAADVVQAMHVLMQWINSKPQQVINGQDIFAGVLAAAAHDYEHPGFSNQFLTRTKHPMALRYNDSMVLENHHISSTFFVLLNMKQDPMQNLTEDQFKQIRRMMIRMVLATDIANHFTELSLLKTKMNSKDFPAKGQDKQLLMNMLLHAADVSNSARPFETFMKWVPRVMEEMFRQGDVERLRQIPISMYHDRLHPNTMRCQGSFMDVIALPLWTVLGQIMPEVRENVLPHLNENREYYSQQEDEFKRQTGEGDSSGKDDGRGRRSSKGASQNWVRKSLRFKRASKKT